MKGYWSLWGAVAMTRNTGSFGNSGAGERLDSSLYVSVLILRRSNISSTLYLPVYLSTYVYPPCVSMYLPICKNRFGCSMSWTIAVTGMSSNTLFYASPVT